jgi:hypothetical protein
MQVASFETEFLAALEILLHSPTIVPSPYHLLDFKYTLIQSKPSTLPSK